MEYSILLPGTRIERRCSGPVAWLGCSKFYHFPPELNLDYGTPTGLCKETAEGSEVFVREWSKSTVQMDCNTYTPTITMKPAGRLVESHSS